jgi:predicted nuclease with TOPRIM domain
MILERLEGLERKVQEVVELLQQCEAGKKALADELKVAIAEKATLRKTVERLEVERKEFRARVDELIEEVSRVEAALQGRR